MTATTFYHTTPFSLYPLWLTGPLRKEKKVDCSTLGLSGSEVDQSILTKEREREKMRMRESLRLNKVYERWRQRLSLDLPFMGLQYNYYVRISSSH